MRYDQTCLKTHVIRRTNKRNRLIYVRHNNRKSWSRICSQKTQYIINDLTLNNYVNTYICISQNWWKNKTINWEQLKNVNFLYILLFKFHHNPLLMYILIYLTWKKKINYKFIMHGDSSQVIAQVVDQTYLKNWRNNAMMYSIEVILISCCKECGICVSQNHRQFRNTRFKTNLRIIRIYTASEKFPAAILGYICGI